MGGSRPVFTPPGASRRHETATISLWIAIDNQHGHRYWQIDDQEPMVVGCYRVAGQMGRHGVFARRAE